mmetsp:Transcript_17912/g.27136  ORF Transcript_17912/g.27136 Transcript_17912/m.27136 type:complete len:222 (+) Transcript_17912:28-693(+)
MKSNMGIPNEKYIILGRGSKNYNHPGNVKFRQLVDRDLPLYVQGNKKCKSEVIEKVINEIQNEGMSFMECSVDNGESTHCWIELNTKESRKKVAHRFRDSARHLSCKSNPRNESDSLLERIIHEVKASIFWDMEIGHSTQSNKISIHDSDKISIHESSATSCGLRKHQEENSCKQTKESKNVTHNRACLNHFSATRWCGLCSPHPTSTGEIKENDPLDFLL